MSQFGAAPDLQDEKRLREGEAIWRYGLGPSLFWYSLTALVLATGTGRPFLWALGAPMVLSATIGYVRLACDHIYEEARNNSIAEQLAGCTNIEAPFWQEVLLAPHGAGYHGVHHVAPGVGHWYWKEAHRRLAASGSRLYASTVYPGYGAVFGRLFREQHDWSRARAAASRAIAPSACDDSGGAARAASGPAATAAGPAIVAAPAARGEMPDLLGGDERPATAPRFVNRSVEEIAGVSRAAAFGLEAIPWTEPDRSRNHAPESMSHLPFTDVWSELEPEERLTYNHAHADGVCEQFMFLEDGLFVKALQSFLRKGGKLRPPAMREACEFFIAEEEKHSRMFRKLLIQSRPEVYEERAFDVYRLSPAEERFMEVSTSHPDHFLWWIWIATLFEEKTLDFHRKHQADRDSLDPVYVAVHRFHALDELRHFQMDHHFLELLWAPAPTWKKALNARIFRRIMWSFAHPRRTVRAAVDVLLRRHERLAPMRERLLAAGMGVSASRKWHEATYSRQTLPETFALFDRYPEMHAMSEVLPLYQPPAAGS